MDVTLLQLTAVIYLLATGSFILYLVLAKDFFSHISPLIVLSGFLIHTAALGVYFFNTGYPAIAQFREALSFYSWLMVGVYLLVQLKYRLTVLGCFIAPLAFLMSLAAITFGVGGGELPPTLKTYWLPLHVTLAFLGNAFPPFKILLGDILQVVDVVEVDVVNLIDARIKIVPSVAEIDEEHRLLLPLSQDLRHRLRTKEKLG